MLTSHATLHCHATLGMRCSQPMPHYTRHTAHDTLQGTERNRVENEGERFVTQYRMRPGDKLFILEGLAQEAALNELDRVVHDGAVEDV